MKNLCGDCGVSEGEIHLNGCDMERCTNCGGQLISCNCPQKFKGKEEPYFERVFCCARCGKKEPPMLMVSNETWRKICGQTYDLDDVLCPNCMRFIARKRGMEVGEGK